MVRYAQKYYPYIPVKILLKDKYESLKKLPKINTPTLVMHGEKDKIVPFQMGKKIYENLKGPRFSYFVKYDDHMMDFNDDLINSINNFIESLN